MSRGAFLFPSSGVRTKQRDLGGIFGTVITASEPVSEGLDLYVFNDAAPRGQRLIYNLPARTRSSLLQPGKRRRFGAVEALGEVAGTVADTGIGMDPKEIPRALQPFGQIEIVLTRTQGGTGLGLLLARRLVELHGGEMTIERARAAGHHSDLYPATHLRHSPERENYL